MIGEIVLPQSSTYSLRRIYRAVKLLQDVIVADDLSAIIGGR
jgi:hypothetical protein